MENYIHEGPIRPLTDPAFLLLPFPGLACHHYSYSYIEECYGALRSQERERERACCHGVQLAIAAAVALEREFGD